MGSKKGRWVAKLEADGWVATGYVDSAPGSYLYASSLGSNPDISQKYKMGDISKGVANTI